MPATHMLRHQEDCYPLRLPTGHPPGGNTRSYSHHQLSTWYFLRCPDSITATRFAENMLTTHEPSAQLHEVNLLENLLIREDSSSLFPYYNGSIILASEYAGSGKRFHVKKLGNRQVTSYVNHLLTSQLVRPPPPGSS